MDVHGHINLLNNEMQQFVMQTEVDFPTSPTVGRLIFRQKRVYICVEIATGVPVWVPLTNEIDTYLHDQSCGKCVFCREGTFQMSSILEDISKGNGEPQELCDEHGRPC